jgi:hypothetical protein
VDVSDYASVILAVLAVGTLVVAWSQWREVVRRRHVDMYWRVFDVYNSADFRASRDAFFTIEKLLGLDEAAGLTKRLEATEVADCSAKYWEKFYRGDRYHQKLDRLARTRVRFYAQTGVLLRARLVDEDLLFGLIGPSLDVDMRLLDIVITANRTGHDFSTMYDEVYHAYREYRRWRRGERRPGWVRWRVREIRGRWSAAPPRGDR